MTHQVNQLLDSPGEEMVTSYFMQHLSKAIQRENMDGCSVKVIGSWVHAPMAEFCSPFCFLDVLY